VHPRTRKSRNNAGTGTPIAQRSIHPTLPFSFFNIGFLLVFHISGTNPPAADPFNSMSLGELEYAIFFEPHAA